MKKNILSLFIFTILSYSIQAYAKVTPFITDDMAVIEKDAFSLSHRYTGEKVLIAYDIDNTLLSSPDNGEPAKNCDLMTTQWWNWQVNLIATNSSSAFRVAKDKQQLIYISDRLLPLMHMVKIDPHIDQALQDEQQNLHNKVIAISARDSNLYSATLSQLNTVNIDFASSALGDADGISGYIKPTPFTRPIQYNQGVLLLAGQNKGMGLTFLLAYYPKQSIKAIIFVDDLQVNIDNVAAAFKDSSVDVHVYLYTKEKARVAQFNADNKTHVNAQWVEINAALKDSFDLDSTVTAVKK